MLSYTEGNTFLPLHRLQTAENVLVSHLFLHNCFAHLIISHYQNFLLFTFNFYHSLWPWCSQCPRLPSLWHRASCYHHRSGWFQCSWGKPTRQSWHSCLQFLPLFSLGHLPPGLYTMLFHSPELCDPKLSYSILRTFPILAPLFLWPVQDH